MSERHVVAILTALIRAQNPRLDGDAAVLQAMAMARGGMGESELTAALEMALQAWEWPGEGYLRPGAEEVLQDVDFALGVREAGRKP